MADLQDSTIDDLTISQSMTISGNFLRPNLPVVSVSKDNGGVCYSTLGPVPFNITHHINNISSSNSNSRFTVNEDGKYFCLFWTIGHNLCGSTGRLNIKVNGSNSSAQARSDHSIRYGNCYAFKIYDLVVGDYIEATLTDGALHLNNDFFNKFVIYKII